MSATKNLIMTYEEMIGKDLDDFTDKDFLKIETTDILQNTALPCDPQTIEFFDDIYGSDNRTDLKRWIMVSDHNNQVNYGYTNQSDLIQAIFALLPNEYNLFFTPALFFGWRTDAHAHYIRTIFIDIDGIDEYFPSMDDLQIKQWLIDTYRLPDQLLPNWVVASGHGLHLYYIVDELDLFDPSQSGLRKTYTGYLLTYFHGDIACRNPSHIMRVPGSYNIKRKPYPQTVLHHLNTDKNYKITRLDYFQTSADAVTAYQKAQQEEINAKRLETRKRNQLSKEEPTEPTDKTEEQPQENHPAKTKCISPHTAVPNPAYKKVDIAQMKARHINRYTIFDPKQRNWNIIKDLNNYYYRHNGEIQGCRNTFFAILSTYLKYVMDLEAALTFALKYASDDFREEAIKVITGIYNRKTSYRYRNVTIAEELHFTDRDIEESFSNFSIERQQEARKKALEKSNRAQSSLRKAQREGWLNDFYQSLINDDCTIKESSLMWGVSESTVKRARRKLKSLGLL